MRRECGQVRDGGDPVCWIWELPGDPWFLVLTGAFEGEKVLEQREIGVNRNSLIT